MKKILLLCLALVIGISLTGCKKEIVSEKVTEAEWKEILNAKYDSYTMTSKSTTYINGKQQHDEGIAYYIDGMQFYTTKVNLGSEIKSYINYNILYKNYSFSHYIATTRKDYTPYVYSTTSVMKTESNNMFSIYANEYNDFVYDSSAKGYKREKNGDVLILKFKDKKLVEMSEKTRYSDSLISFTKYGTTKVEKPIQYFIEEDCLFEVVDGKYYFLASFKEEENIILPKTIRNEPYAIKHLAFLSNTKSITLQNTIISIDEDAVLDPCKFETIQFCGTEEQWNTLLSKTSLASNDFFGNSVVDPVPVQIQFIIEEV